jgi:hypothetical protein
VHVRLGKNLETSQKAFWWSLFDAGITASHAQELCSALVIAKQRIGLLLVDYSARGVKKAKAAYRIKPKLTVEDFTGFGFISTANGSPVLTR